MIKSLFLRFNRQILTLTFLGFLVSILEAIGVSLCIPILQGVQSQQFHGLPTPIMWLANQLNQFPFDVKLRLIAIGLIFIFVSKNLLMYINGIQGVRLEIDATNYYLTQCYKNMLNSQSTYFNKQKGSFFYTIMRQHVGRYGHIVRLIADNIPALFTFIVLLIMLCAVSLMMTVFALSFALLSALSMQFLQKRAVHSGEAIADANLNIDATLLDSIQGLKTIKMFVRSENMTRKFQSNIMQWGKCLIGVAKVQSAIQPIFEITSIIGLALLLIVGSFLFKNEEQMQMEVLLTFLLIFFRILPVIVSINRFRVSLSTMLPVCNNVNEYLIESSQNQDKKGIIHFDKLRSNIEFHQVMFKYLPEQEWVLNDISFHVLKGQRIGIVGASGSGKSTIIELLLKFYLPHNGKILVDGKNLEELDADSWRRQIGVVSQDTFLFNDTIKSNIAFANPEVSQNQIEQAAKRAHIHDFILSMTNGYDTVVGDRGVLLSGGQRQRIAIARAILMEPEILVFDEATSALDSESEQIVQEALDDIAQGRTVFAIAHRLSTVRNFDKIIVLDKGKIVEVGVHQELIKMNGVYSSMACLQSLDI